MVPITDFLHILTEKNKQTYKKKNATLKACILIKTKFTKIEVLLLEL